MDENRWPVRVAVNVKRARLTVIGFNIAIVSFQHHPWNCLRGYTVGSQLDQCLCSPGECGRFRQRAWVDD